MRACAREPGHRTKIAVWSNDQNVDPVGACVGARGARVRMVTNELRGERVDVVPFSDDPAELIQPRSPAVKEVRLDEETGTATVIVHDFQLSLAIGKEGQNARLAARLTGWRIDIKSESQLADEEAGDAGEEWAEGEWVQNESGEMVCQPAEGGAACRPQSGPSGDEVAEARQRRRGRGRGRARGRVRRRRREPEGPGPEAVAAGPAPTDGVKTSPRMWPKSTRRQRRVGRPGRPGIAPVRTCIGCRRTRPTAADPADLRPGDGSLLVGPAGQDVGRGCAGTRRGASSGR